MRRGQQFATGLAAGILLGVVATLAVLRPGPATTRVERSAPTRPARPGTLPAAPPPEVYFSPDGGATGAVVSELGRARQSVRVHPMQNGRRRSAAEVHLGNPGSNKRKRRYREDKELMEFLRKL